MSAPINVTADGKVTKIILREGTGEQAKKGQKVSVHYVGTLASDGSQFDSSRDRGTPFQFTIGQGVITGWSEGVATMKVGELSRFTIDSEYGYGAAGSPPKIPGGATLVFEIELLKILTSYTNKEEALAAVEQFNTKAAEEFRAGKYAEAKDLYLEAMDALNDYFGKEVDEWKVKLNRNLSVAYSKLGDWRESLEMAEKVLKKEANDLKALMRKLEAHVQLGDAENARAALNKGLTASKNHPSFIAFKDKVNELEKAARIEANKLYAKMVGK